MPRSNMIFQPTQAPNGVNLGLLQQVFPLEHVQAAVQEANKSSTRVRCLPASLVVFLVMAFSLRSEYNTAECLAALLEPFRFLWGPKGLKPAKAPAICRARARLGAEPLRLLFNQRVAPICEPDQGHGFWRGWRLIAVDGSTLEVPDSTSNREAFGIHCNQHAEAGYPQLKWVALNECGSRVIWAVNHGGTHVSEASLFEPLIARLLPGMLLLADRGFFRFDHWKQCVKQGCALIWRVKSSLILTPEKVLSDGTYLAYVSPSNKLCKSERATKGERILVRVIEYYPVFEDGSSGEVIRLITTLLDPEEAPADEIAGLYPCRWGIETGFDEFKTHMKGAGRLLRSQSKEMVEQEWYGMLLAYFAICKVRWDAMRETETPFRQISFVHTMNVLNRRGIPVFPPRESSGLAGSGTGVVCEFVGRGGGGKGGSPSGASECPLL
jgi:hypothetical protein